MILINYPTAFKALDNYIDCFNSKAPKTTGKLKTGAVFTAKEIIRIYGVSLLKYVDIDKTNLPPLHTNNQQLAKLVKCSTRSVQRNINKLLIAGVLTKKVFHGRLANYELVINPDLLFTKVKISVENVKKEYDAALLRAKQNEAELNLKEIQTTKSPVSYTLKKINNILREVHKSENPLQKITGNTTGNTGEIVPAFLKEQTGSAIFFQGTGEIASRVEQSVETISADPARDNSLSLNVKLLWMMAKKLLYHDKDLTESQVSIAKALILKLYEPVPDSHLSIVHQIYVKRISLVAKYLKKDPTKRFVTLPYIYFDTKNLKGFVGTKKWYEADQIRKKEVERELLLKRTMRKYAENEKESSVKKKDTLQLYKECENTIGKLNDPSLTQCFRKAVVHYENYKEIIYPS